MHFLRFSVSKVVLVCVRMCARVCEILFYAFNTIITLRCLTEILTNRYEKVVIYVNPSTIPLSSNVTLRLTCEEFKYIWSICVTDKSIQSCKCHIHISCLASIIFEH